MLTTKWDTLKSQFTAESKRKGMEKTISIAGHAVYAILTIDRYGQITFRNDCVQNRMCRCHMYCQQSFQLYRI